LREGDEQRDHGRCAVVHRCWHGRLFGYERCSRKPCAGRGGTRQLHKQPVQLPYRPTLPPVPRGSDCEPMTTEGINVTAEVRKALASVSPECAPLLREYLRNRLHGLHPEGLLDPFLPDRIEALLDLFLSPDKK